MALRSLVFISVLVGLTVAAPPGSVGVSFGRQGGGGGGVSSTPGSQGDNRRLGSGNAEGSFDYGASSSAAGVPPGSFSDGVTVSGQQNQQQKPFQFGFSADGQKQGGQIEGVKQGQSFYQFRPQGGTNSQQVQSIQAAGLQPNQAYVPSNQPFFQHQSSPSGLSQQNTWDTTWQQNPQQGQHLPGYGYTSSPSFSSYMPHTAAMGYLPSAYNHMPMVIAASHEFTPFSAGYGGYQVGVSMPQVYPHTLYGNQGSQRYGVVPVGSTQGQFFTQGQITPNAQEAYLYSPMASAQSQLSSQKQGQYFTQGGITPNVQGSYLYSPVASTQSQANNQKQSQYFTPGQTMPNTQETYLYSPVVSTQSQETSQKLPQVQPQNNEQMETSQ